MDVGHGGLPCSRDSKVLKVTDRLKSAVGRRARLHRSQVTNQDDVMQKTGIVDEESRRKGIKCGKRRYGGECLSQKVFSGRREVRIHVLG